MAVGMLKPSEIDYKSGYFREAGVEWNAKSISAGATTDELPTLEYTNKTFYFLSNTAGTLTVQVKEPDGEWQTYDSLSVSAGVLTVYTMTGQAIAVRLSFSASAVVTAWYVMR
jgi:hypothetical protein